MPLLKETRAANDVSHRHGCALLRPELEAPAQSAHSRQAGRYHCDPIELAVLLDESNHLIEPAPVTK